MKKLYILYDPSCEFCWRCRGWLQRQPAYLDLEFIASRSPEVWLIFPDLRRPAPCGPSEKDELVVISDEGGVYRGAPAFIMCLYALEEYRDWAEWLASPTLLPLAKPAFEMLSHNRGLINEWLVNGGEKYLAAKLKTIGTES